MKRLFSTTINTGAVDFWLLLFRIAIGITMLTHGIPKFNNLMSGNVQFPDPLGLGAGPSLTLTVFSEALCSILLILGLATRLAVIPLIINMLIAIFYIHGQDPFGQKELATLYLLIYIGFLIVGPGKFAIDTFIGGRSKRRW